MSSRVDSIKKMKCKPWFKINKIFNTPIVLKIEKFLDCSDMAIKELAYSMQRSTPQNQVKKSPMHKVDYHIAAYITVYLPPIISNGFDNDKLS